MVITNDKLYDILKFVAQVGLPALATLYFTLAGIWGLPKADEVVGTIVAIDLFLGTLLQLSTAQYKKSDDRFDGEINALGKSDGGDVGNFNMSIPLSAEELEGKDEVVLKVNSGEKKASPKRRRKRSK